MAVDRSFDHRTLDHLILISNHFANEELIVKVCVWFSFISPGADPSLRPRGGEWRHRDRQALCRLPDFTVDTRDSVFH